MKFFQRKKKANAGLVVLSVLLPFLGIIFSAVWWSKKHHAAKVYLTASLISAAVFFVLIASGVHTSEIWRTLVPALFGILAF